MPSLAARAAASLGAGIAADVRGRLPHYAADWRDGFAAGARILAPATYIFLASALPAIAFGQQLADDTAGALGLVQVLIATAISGIVQAVLGGQPLLIIGVAEPIVLIYGFMYAFAAAQPGLGPALFLPWAAWVCVWTAALVLALAVCNASGLIDKFTRFSGETFGMLIAVLFMQVGVKGLIREFGPARDAGLAAPPGAPPPPPPPPLADTANGLWALLLALGLLAAAAASRGARRWRFLRGWVRGLLADYGCPLAFIAVTALSFALRGVPGAPRRVVTPDTWALPPGSFLAAGGMDGVPPVFVAAALVPALAIAVLFLFDHSVSSQLAQQKEFNLKRPPAYHYDLFLLSLLTLLCGLLGLPPVNGVLPQAPMHTRALATLKAQTNKAAMKKAASQAALADADPSAGPGTPFKVNGSGPGGAEPLTVDGRGDADVLPIEVNEQRLTGLLQSALVALCLALTPAIKLVPTAVLWGYFAFMSLESLPGSQFWERLQLLVTDPRRRYVVLERDHAAYLQLVPFRAVAGFTAVQLAALLGVWALTTFGGVASFLFPLPIMALVPLRQYVLPLLFSRADLAQLDAADYEEAPALPHAAAVRGAAEGGLQPAPAAEDGAPERAAEALGAATRRFQIAHRVSAEEVARRQLDVRQGRAAAGAAAGGGGGGGGGGALWRRHSHEV